MASVLFGVVLGATGIILTEPVSGRPAPRAVADAGAPSTPAAPSNSPTPEPTGSVETSSAQLVRSVRLVTFTEPAASPDGLSLTVLRPEKVPGGVRLTIALANPTDGAITVDTAELGPHDPRFDGAPVPMTMTSAEKKLVPGEGYTYECVIKLPTMDVGQLALTLGPVTVTGAAAGD